MKTDAVAEAQEKERMRMLREQRRADKKRKEEDEERRSKLEEIRNGRMASIMKNAEKKKETLGKVEEFKRRMQSEERQRIKEKLETHE